MDKYIADVDIWTNDIVNQRISDKRIKDALLDMFEDKDGPQTVLSTVIDNMKRSFSDDNRCEEFKSMLHKDFGPYLKFMTIDRESFRIDERDRDFSTITFAFSFDNEKALAKAEKAFKKLQQSSGVSR